MTNFFFGVRGPHDVDDGQGMTFETDLAAFEAALWLAAELSSNYPDLRGNSSVVVTPTGRREAYYVSVI
jgi:hypothetical protein